MAEMEQRFTDSTNDNDSTLGANTPELELQRWQQWRNVDLARSAAQPTGSSAQPIEIDCGSTADNSMALARGEEERAAGGPEGDAPLAVEEETLWGHAIHEHELSAGDQVRCVACVPSILRRQRCYCNSERASVATGFGGACVSVPSVGIDGAVYPADRLTGVSLMADLQTTKHTVRIHRHLCVVFSVLVSTTLTDSTTIEVNLSAVENRECLSAVENPRTCTQ